MGGANGTNQRRNLPALRAGNEGGRGVVGQRNRVRPLRTEHAYRSARATGSVPSGTEVYNIVSDTVAGINVRWKDNVIQFAVIAACVPIGALIGALAMEDWRPGVLIGGFVGLLVGFFGSGTFLMIYRFIRHAARRSPLIRRATMATWQFDRK